MQAIRATCLLQFRDQVLELGADPDVILRSSGVAPEDAGRADRFISLRGGVTALELAADITGCTDFGLRLAARRGIETIGPVGLAAQGAGNLGDAFTILGTFITAHSPGIRVDLTPSADQTTSFFEFRLLLDPPPRARQAIELSLGASLQILRALVGADYAPVSVHLPHSAISPKASYLRYLGCSSPHFAQPRAGFVIRAADLRRPLRHDRHTDDGALTALAKLLPEPAPPVVTDTVTDLVRTLLPTGALSIELVSAQLQLHPRALQRRLAAEGASYVALVEKVRRQTAEHCLRDTDISLDHVTRLLGYAEQSVLTRSCKRWFGCPPSTYRANNR